MRQALTFWSQCVVKLDHGFSWTEGSLWHTGSIKRTSEAPYLTTKVVKSTRMATQAIALYRVRSSLKRCHCRCLCGIQQSFCESVRAA